MSRKIGIVGGTGPEGSGLAARWAAAGEHIIIGSRDASRAAETAKLLRARLGSNAKIEGADNASAVAQCEVDVLTVPFSAQAALLKQLKPHWKPGHGDASPIGPWPEPRANGQFLVREAVGGGQRIESFAEGRLKKPFPRDKFRVEPQPLAQYGTSGLSFLFLPRDLRPRPLRID